jgi:hypothetical protein
VALGDGLIGAEGVRVDWLELAELIEPMAWPVLATRKAVDPTSTVPMSMPSHRADLDRAGIASSLIQRAP